LDGIFLLIERAVTAVSLRSLGKKAEKRDLALSAGARDVASNRDVASFKADSLLVPSLIFAYIEREVN
jgi:hypothetical protein